MFGEYAQVASYMQPSQNAVYENDTFDEEQLPAYLRPSYNPPQPWNHGRGKSGLGEDFIMIAEFSELEGPKPLMTIPKDGGENFDQNTFALRILAVDHQNSTDGFSISEDAQIVVCDSEAGVFAFVHHLVLYDNTARGFVRPYCIAFITADQRKLMYFYEELSWKFKKVARYLKYGNKMVFVGDIERHLKDLEYTKTVLLNQVCKMRLRSSEGTEDQVQSVRKNAENELYRGLQTIQQSNSELRDILSVLRPLLPDRRLEARFRLLEDRAYQGSSTAGLDKMSLPESGFTEFSTIDNIDIRCGSLTESRISPLALFKPREYKPVIVETKKAKRFNAPLRGLHELCSWGAKEGLKKLRYIHEYFKRDLAVLELHKNESRLFRPRCASIYHGQCITGNFLSGVHMKKSLDAVEEAEHGWSMLYSNQWSSVGSLESEDSFKSADSFPFLNELTAASPSSFHTYDSQSDHAFLSASASTEKEFSLLMSNEYYNDERTYCDDRVTYTETKSAPVHFHHSTSVTDHMVNGECSPEHLRTSSSNGEYPSRNVSSRRVDIIISSQMDNPKLSGEIDFNQKFIISDSGYDSNQMNLDMKSQGTNNNIVINKDSSNDNPAIDKESTFDNNKENYFHNPVINKESTFEKSVEQKESTFDKSNEYTIDNHVMNEESTHHDYAVSKDSAHENGQCRCVSQSDKLTDCDERHKMKDEFNHTGNSLGTLSENVLQDRSKHLADEENVLQIQDKHITDEKGILEAQDKTREKYPEEGTLQKRKDLTGKNIRVQLLTHNKQDGCYQGRPFTAHSFITATNTSFSNGSVNQNSFLSFTHNPTQILPSSESRSENFCTINGMQADRNEEISPPKLKPFSEVRCICSDNGVLPYIGHEGYVDTENGSQIRQCEKVLPAVSEQKHNQGNEYNVNILLVSPRISHVDPGISHGDLGISHDDLEISHGGSEISHVAAISKNNTGISHDGLRISNVDPEISFANTELPHVTRISQADILKNYIESSQRCPGISNVDPGIPYAETGISHTETGISHFDHGILHANPRISQDSSASLWKSRNECPSTEKPKEELTAEAISRLAIRTNTTSKLSHSLRPNYSQNSHLITSSQNSHLITSTQTEKCGHLRPYNDGDLVRPRTSSDASSAFTEISISDIYPHQMGIGSESKDSALSDGCETSAVNDEYTDIPTSQNTASWKPRCGLYTVGDWINNLSMSRPGFGLADVLSNYQYLEHVIYSLLCGRLVVVAGPAKMEPEVIKIVNALAVFVPVTRRKSHTVLEWTSRPLRITDLIKLKLIGVCRPERRTLDSFIPGAIKNMHYEDLAFDYRIIPVDYKISYYKKRDICEFRLSKQKAIHLLKKACTIFDVEKRLIVAPPYKGQFIAALVSKKKVLRSDVQLLAYIEWWLMDILAKAFIFFHSFCLGSAGNTLHSHSPTDQRDAYQEIATGIMARLGVRDCDTGIIEHLTEIFKLSKMESFIWQGVDSDSVATPLTLQQKICEKFRC